MGKKRLGRVKVEPVQPLILRTNWQGYEQRIHEAIGLDVRYLTGVLTEEDEEVLRHRDTQALPTMEDYHDQPTQWGTYTTIPAMETRK